NLPVFSVDNSAVTEFSAKVGEKHEQTVTISATGLLDAGKIRVLGQGNAAFQISSTMFLKDGTSTLRVTFAPKTEGTFTEVIEFSADKAETKTITVTGKTTGGAVVGDKEGDELVFDTTNPLTYYATDFSNSGARNKPLVLEGWKNVAVQGNRAWWSYTDGDNTVAKVTSYIWGGATSDEPTAEMLLLSPALDYKNCTSRLLSFRIKGENLTDAQMGQLSVLYIDPTLPETERYQVLLGGSDIPVGAEAEGEWAEYVVDLEGLDLADVFFIGFHYISGAGASSPETYYVDDFCYGSTTQPFIRVDKHQVVASTETGKPVDLETITVTGLNLTEPIAVALEGKHKDLFSGYSETLPAKGGQLNFKYSPIEAGEHNVYVNLTSAGAPATQLIIGGKADNSSGITLPGVDNASEITVYDLQGRTVVPATGAAEAYKTLRTLEKDIYVLRITTADGTVKTVKYVRP
ncbi:MAG: T9SS type A sorting domain-containing protein, partial [Muribaculaceae bacterium]